MIYASNTSTGFDGEKDYVLFSDELNDPTLQALVICGGLSNMYRPNPAHYIFTGSERLRELQRFTKIVEISPRQLYPMIIRRLNYLSLLTTTLRFIKRVRRLIKGFGKRSVTNE